MKEQDNIFSKCKSMDYRNAKYQGIMNGIRRQQFGLIIDDDMNLYFSQWKDGKLSGMTFLYYSGGSYMYGWWRQNQPHGVNVYRNGNFLMVSNYINGQPTGDALAITDNGQQIIVFDSSQIGKKQKAEIRTFQQMMEIAYLQDVVYHWSKKNKINIENDQTTLVKFLSKIALKYDSQLLTMRENEGYYYFGFQRGLGMKFSLHGKLKQRIVIYSIGWHEGGRLFQYGAKYHDHRCIEQGNFISKETITYNRLFDRPKDKTSIIYQKIHKRALNFINEYFQMRKQQINTTDSFLNQKLLSACHQLVREHYEINKKTQDLSDSRKQFYRQAKEQFNKKSIQIKHKSTSHYKRLQDLSAKKKDTQLGDHEPTTIKRAIEPLHSHYYKDGCPKIKKRINRSKSKDQNKSLSQKSKSKSTAQLSNLSQAQRQNVKVNNEPTREIKYLINYQKPQINKENDLNISGKTMSPMNRPKIKQKSANYPRVAEQNQREREGKQVENQLKIREQLYQKEMMRDISYQNLNQHHTYNLNNHPSLPTLSVAYNKTPLGLSVFNNNYQPLQNKRERLIKQFRMLNTREELKPKFSQQINSIYTQFNSSRHWLTGLQNHQKIIKSPPTNYDRYRQPQIKLSNKYYKQYESPSKDWSPQKHIISPTKSIRNRFIEESPSRYRYYFDN